MPAPEGPQAGPSQDGSALQQIAAELRSLAVDFAEEASKRPYIICEVIDELCDLSEQADALAELAESGDPLQYLQDWFRAAVDRLWELRDE